MKTKEHSRNKAAERFKAGLGYKTNQQQQRTNKDMDLHLK